MRRFVQVAALYLAIPGGIVLVYSLGDIFNWVGAHAGIWGLYPLTIGLVYLIAVGIRWFWGVSNPWGFD